MARLLVVLIILAGVVATIFWQWSAITGLYQYVSHIGSKPQTQAGHETPSAQPKFSGRVPQEQSAGQAPGTSAPQCADGPGRGAAHRALRGGPERSAGSTLCRLRHLADGDHIAGSGACSRAGHPCGRGNPGTQNHRYLVAAPQYRQGAAGKPHDRDHVQPSGGFSRRRHRQRTRHPDEAGRAGARHPALPDSPSR